MKYRLFAVLALLALPAIAQEPPLPQHPLITPERTEDLLAGEAVVIKTKDPDEKDNAAAKAAVLLIINAPAKATFDTITDFGNQHEYMPRLQKVESYELPAPEQGQAFTVKVAWKTIKYHLRVTADHEKLHEHWTLDPDKPNDIAKTVGSWDILPWGDNKCVAVYQLEVDTGMAVPRFISQMLLNQDLPGVVNALKQRVESGGKYKKDD